MTTATLDFPCYGQQTRRVVTSRLYDTAPTHAYLTWGDSAKKVVVSAPSPRAKALNALRREMLQYLELPANWDGYAGLPAHPQAMLDALEFLSRLPNEVAVPAPMLSGAGMVGLYWDRSSQYASLEFEGDGTYTYLTDGPDGYGGAEGVAAATLPTTLRGYLSSLTHAE